METLRLPKKIENEPQAGDLARELITRARPLWAGAQLSVPQAEIGPVKVALKTAALGGRVVRGLEGAERALATAERGLARVDEKTGVERGGRVSRLLLLADDGAPRFYRNVETLLQRHAPRVLAIRLSVDERALGELLFGADQVARLVLVDHKDAVSDILLALALEWGRGAN